MAAPHSRDYTSKCKETLELSLETNNVLRGPTKKFCY